MKGSGGCAGINRFSLIITMPSLICQECIKFHEIKEKNLNSNRISTEIWRKINYDVWW